MLSGASRRRKTRDPERSEG